MLHLLRNFLHYRSSKQIDCSDLSNREAQRASFLWTINISSILILVLLELGRLLQGVQFNKTDIMLVLLVLALYASCFSLRKGWVKQSIMLVLSVGWVAFTILALFGEGIYDPASMGYFIIILMATLLTDKKVILSFAILSIASFWLLAYFYSTHLILAFPDSPFGVARDFTCVFLMISALTLMYSRTQNESLIKVKHELEERLKTEASLRLSEVKYRDIIENMQDVYYRGDASGKLNMISPSGVTLLGYSCQEEMIDKPIAQTFYCRPDDRKQLEDMLSRKGNVVNHEVELKRKNGSPVSVATTTHLLFGQDGEYLGFEGVFRDITALKKAERTIRENEERFRSIVETVPDAIFISGKSGRIIIANEAAATQTGYTVEELSRLNVMDLVAPCFRLHTKSRILELRDEPLFYESIHLAKNGTEVNVEVAVKQLHWQGRHFILCVSRDISERKEAHQKLEKSERTYRQSIEAIGGVPYVSELCSGKFTFIGDGIEKLTGFPVQEISLALIRSLVQQAVPLGDLSGLSLAEATEKAMSGELSVWNCDLLITTKQGEPRWISDSAVLVKGEQGRQNAIGILQDITGRKKAEEELLLAKEQAEEINKIKSVFFANMSHELRTPLMGMLGYANVLATDLTDPEFKSMADTIKKSGARLLDTSKQILDITKLEVDKVIPVIEQVNVVEAISAGIKLFEESAWMKGLYLKAEIHCGECLILADRHLFSDVLNNLLNNAIKFTAEGGVTVTARQRHHKIYIEIEDTGIGISEKNLGIIFEEFRQESEGMSRSFEGTGLGLTIAKKYIQLMHGEITVSSVFGKGSQFTVIFPMVTDFFPLGKINRSGSHPNVLQQHAPAGKKLLLVENDEVNISVIAKFLEKHYELEVAVNGEEALEKIAEQPYDAILLDINLGNGPSGIQVMQKAKGDGFCRNTPVIAMTAFAMDGDREEFLRAGCTHYIAKPFQKNELLELLVSVF